MAKLIVVAGLPGAGKSTYLDDKQKSGEFDVVYDDYFGTSIKKPNSPDELHLDKNPLKNTRYINIIEDLIANKNVAVCDIVFCIAKYRNIFIASIIAAVSEIDLEFVFFTNEGTASQKNVHTRAREGRVEKEIELIDSISSQYSLVEVSEVKTHEA